MRTRAGNVRTVAESTAATREYENGGEGSRLYGLVVTTWNEHLLDLPQSPLPGTRYTILVAYLYSYLVYMYLVPGVHQHSEHLTNSCAFGGPSAPEAFGLTRLQHGHYRHDDLFYYVFASSGVGGVLGPLFFYFVILYCCTAVYSSINSNLSSERCILCRRSHPVPSAFYRVPGPRYH